MVHVDSRFISCYTHMGVVKYEFRCFFDIVIGTIIYTMVNGQTVMYMAEKDGIVDQVIPIVLIGGAEYIMQVGDFVSVQGRYSKDFIIGKYKGHATRGGDMFFVEVMVNPSGVIIEGFIAAPGSSYKVPRDMVKPYWLQPGDTLTVKDELTRLTVQYLENTVVGDRKAMVRFLAGKKGFSRSLPLSEIIKSGRFYYLE